MRGWVSRNRGPEGDVSFRATWKFFLSISSTGSPLVPGNENALVLTGSDLGWSGPGTFHFFEETTRFNGTFVIARYGGETPGEDFDGALLETSRIEFEFVPESGGTMFLFAIGVVAVIWVARASRALMPVRLGPKPSRRNNL